MSSSKLFSYKSNQNANMQIVQREIMRGFNPKWYAVIHLMMQVFKCQQKRRLDMDEVEVDLNVVMINFTRTLRTKVESKNRSKSIWVLSMVIVKSKPYKLDY